MPKLSISLCWVLSVFWFGGMLGTKQACAKSEQVSQAIEPFQHHFGVYLKGHKVGWMRSELIETDSGEIGLQMHLEAKVAGMKQETTLRLTEKRFYRRKDGALLMLDFEQSSPTGMTRMRGEPSKKGFILTTLGDGEHQHKSVFEQVDTLEDALAPMRLARAHRVGQKKITRHLDPSLGKVLTVHYQTKQLLARHIAGVDTQAVEIFAEYPEIHLKEEHLLNRYGHILESKAGGFFEIRAEAEEMAKHLDATYDLLQGSVLPVEESLGNPREVKRMYLRFAGLKYFALPVSERQSWRGEGDGKELVLLPETPLKKELLKDLQQEVQNRGELARFLVADAILQSDHPLIQKEARRIAGDSQDSSQIISKLIRYVYTQIQSEYVPAYSNALEVLRSKRGDCTEHSVLFTALARALGIPAQVVVGLVYWPAGHGFGWHAWSEVWNQGKWHAVDPTWNQLAVDATHIKLAGGDPFQQAQIISILSDLKIESLHRE